MKIIELAQQFSIPGVVSFEEMHPGFPVIVVDNEYATASISLYGGHLLNFHPHGQSQSLIWLSDSAIYKPGKAIRGGIPVCWPWFGDNSRYPEQPAHGFARIALWQIVAIQNLTNGTTQIDLLLPCQSNCQNYQALDSDFNAQLSIRFIIGRQLQVTLETNNQTARPLTITQALHSYLRISDIDNVTVSGLDKISYLDKLHDNSCEVQNGDLKIIQETDRVYLDSPQTVYLNDPGLNRQIIVAKKNALSTVLWNPWKEKSGTMNDMTVNGWRSMICIESGNIDKNAIIINPGQKQQLSTMISVEDR